MGTAMFTGVTALLVHQRRLDVIANNIANVNTIGYRGGRMSFQDLISQTLEGARGATDASGGRNPSQIGLGVRIGAIDTNFTQGAFFTTGVNTDLAIQGNGFFVLSDGTNQLFTRDGTFSLNTSGQLIDPATGLFVLGYIADATGAIDTTADPTPITIPIGGESISRTTTEAILVGNLSSDAVAGDTIVRTVRVFDSLGTPRDVVITFTKTATTNEWDWEATFDATSVGTGTLTFNPDGSFASQTGDTGASITFPAGDTQPDPLTFTIDFTALTQMSGDSDVILQSQDGFARGVLEAFNIGRDGVVNGIFSNGLTREIAQVTVATFANVGGLSRAGNNLFLSTAASGVAQLGPSNTGGRGEVTGGVLERSNVDLGTEFSELIITQRAFQANARTITTADTMLQEAVNLVR